MDNDEMIICDRCHSHNDYLNDVPILNALKYGYKSIEVDIILDNNHKLPLAFKDDLAKYFNMSRKNIKILIFNKDINNSNNN